MNKSLFNSNISSILLNLFYSLFYQILLLLHGDVETNPGPNKKHKPFTSCHWNVISLTAHNMGILSSIAAYNTIHKYDVIWISETYLDSSVRTDDKDILIYGYNLICADHPSNNKRGDVCIYYQESFAVELVETNYLSECLLCEVSINNKKGYVTVLYRSPSQNSLEFDNFILNFEMMLSDINSSNPHFSIILGDFIARSNNW